MKVIENIKMIITAMARLLIIIMVYNLTLLMGIVFGGAFVVLLDEVFISNIYGFSILETIKPLIVWGMSHLNITIPVIVVLYILGFMRFIGGFASVMRNSFIGINETEV